MKLFNVRIQSLQDSCPSLPSPLPTPRTSSPTRSGAPEELGLSIDNAADNRQSVTSWVTRWILLRLATDGVSVKTCARGLGIGRKRACSLALSACRHLTGGDPDRLHHVRVLGVDEHKGNMSRRFSWGGGTPGFVTVIADLTPQVDGAGPARPLDMVSCRCADALGDWPRRSVPPVP